MLVCNGLNFAKRFALRRLIHARLSDLGMGEMEAKTAITNYERFRAMPVLRSTATSTVLVLRYYGNIIM